MVRKSPKHEEPLNNHTISRRPFIYEDIKLEGLLETYKEADDALFKKRTRISKLKKYY